MQVNQTNDLESYRKDRHHDSRVKITGLSVSRCLQDPVLIPIIQLGEKFAIHVRLDVSSALRGANITLILKNSQGERVAVLISWDHNWALTLVSPGQHTVIVHVDDLPLAPGQYFVDVGVEPSMQSKSYDVIEHFPLLSVVNSGQIVHWLERPWGLLHCNSVTWQTRPTSIGRTVNGASCVE